MMKFTLLATNFTLPPALTGWTNSTSGPRGPKNQYPNPKICLPSVMCIHSSVETLHHPSHTWIHRSFTAKELFNKSKG